jgi:hypothetical protein
MKMSGMPIGAREYDEEIERKRKVIPNLELVPMSIQDAKIFVKRFHRHHQPPLSGLFAIGCSCGPDIVGVAIVGRPVARRLDNGWTAEVTRLCTDGTKNVASKLYAACWRAARAMGWRKLITYTLNTEPGTSLRAAGWRCLGERRSGSWNVPSRPRIDKHPLQRKLKWLA